MSIKVGVIGIGGICKFAHIPALKAAADVEVVALCDIILERAAAVKEESFPKARVTADYRELLAMEEIDAVDICTPNVLHSIIAVEALKAGKHVFCEKPDAISVAEAERMQQAALDSGKRLMIMRNNRFLSSSRFLKEYIAQGKMGEIYCGRCGWVRRRGIPGKGGWFTTKAQSGGGPLIDLGVHMIDLAIWLMGSPRPVAVSGATYCKFATDQAQSDSVHAEFGEAKEGGTFDVEDLAMGFIKFENGACLQVECSWASNIEGESNFVELRGTRAGCSWQLGGVRVFTEEQGVLTDLNPQFPGGESGHALNLQEFFAVLRGEKEPCFQPQQGVDMIKILEAMYESARTGCEVRL